MKEIKLGKCGMYTIVDDEDYEYLSKWKWFAKNGGGGRLYAYRQEFTGERYDNGDKKYTIIFMHRSILLLCDKSILIDHKDRNTLNNTRANLRTANHSQNGANRKHLDNKTSKYLGVNIKKIYRRNKKRDYYFKYIAQICHNRKKIEIGRFCLNESGEVLAAKAYDEAAKKYHGEFANLNFKD